MNCKVCMADFTEKDKPLIVDIPETGPVHLFCYSPYVPETNLRVLVNIRCWSLGDTIAVTPAIRELRRTHPKAAIDVITFFPELFKYSPHVRNVFDRHSVLPSTIANGYIKVLDAFDNTKQRHWATHAVEYSAKATLEKSLHLEDWWTEVHYLEADLKAAKQIAGFQEEDKVILVHPHKTEWETRDWGPSHMPELCRRLKEAYPDHKIVSIGGKRSEPGAINSMDNHVPIEGSVDLYGKLTILQTLALMDLPQVKLLVTPDTGTLHMGGSRKELPIVGIFTLIKPEFRVPVRNGVFGYRFEAVSTSACNCTYDMKSLTSNPNISKCPKRVFLENTLAAGIPTRDKLTGLHNYDGKSWEEEGLSDKIKAELEKYKPGNLLCFPAVDLVFAACAKFLGESKNG